ncbi:MAG: substrate-binding domain-containing protein, partial [Alphaproteobacteria bacterium]
ATVSRALNEPHLVREDVRRRVLAIADRLGYVAHGAARALASRRSRTLGAIVPTIDNTIFARMVDAFQQTLEAAGYNMLLTGSGYDAGREMERARALVERGVDGLMLVGAKHDRRLYDLLSATGTPFINTWTPNRGARHPSIGYDGRALAATIVDHLVRLGHRDIAVVAGHTTHNDRVVTRLAGIAATLRRHGIELPPERLQHRHYSIEEGRAAMREIAGARSLPTAIICNNDILGAGALIEAQAQGIDVPGELSIIGNGDLEIGAHLRPGLTTVSEPKAEMGTWAARYLLDRVEGRELALPPDLPLTLVVRGTTGRPRTRLRAAAAGVRPLRTRTGPRSARR